MVTNFPPMYDFSPSAIEGIWYDLQELLNFINSTYRVAWTEMDLVSRFGLEAEAAQRVKRRPLDILEYSSAGVKIRTYCMAMMPDVAFGKETYFVPAEWVDGYLLISLDEGARQMRIYEGEIVVLDDYNTYILSW